MMRICPRIGSALSGRAEGLTTWSDPSLGREMSGELELAGEGVVRALCW